MKYKTQPLVSLHDRAKGISDDWVILYFPCINVKSYIEKKKNIHIHSFFLI